MGDQNYDDGYTPKNNDSEVEVCGCSASPGDWQPCQYWCRRRDMATLVPRDQLVAAMLVDRCYDAVARLHHNAVEATAKETKREVCMISLMVAFGTSVML